MLFSVVIPIYNKAAYLGETIESVLNQTFSDYELLLVDDGSTDNSIEIAQSFLDSRIHIIRKLNGGVSSARNAGIRASQGEYISFLDADDRWSPDYLETVHGLIDHYGQSAGAFFTAYRIRTSKGMVIPNFSMIYRGRSSGILEDYIAAMKGKYSIVNSSSITARKSLFDVIGYYDERNAIGEDLEIQLKLAMVTSYAFSSKICSEYNRTTTDNTRTRNRIFYPESYLNYIESLLDSDLVTQKQKQDLIHIKNRKYVPYILTLILARNREKIKEVLLCWHPRDKYLCYKVALQFCCLLPDAILGYAKKRYFGV